MTLTLMLSVPPLEGDPLGHFSIRQAGDEWTVFSRQSLDREHTAKYLLRVTASDGTFQVSVPVEVLVLDVNDNSPVCAQVRQSHPVWPWAPLPFCTRS